MSGSDRSRGPPPGEFPPRDPRRAPEGSMSRAEKFEDEKKRIMQSCFSRKDSDGTLVDSYITHVRITEDSAYPSSPPPPNSPPENKKPRVIIVAVRRSGRVRMHKARENNDGTFSIGKTWMLDDLSSIVSYNAFVPSNPLEQQHKQWASNVGFVVTIGKPYYWHARTSKEKEFFIGSLVKIYRKYTGGKVPNLIGFDERERALLVGAPPGAPGAKTSGANSPQGSQSQSPYSSRAPSRDGPKRPPPEEQALRAQRSRDPVGRPSTGQSGKSGTPPFAPPQQPPPSIPLDQPPPRADARMPKAPIAPPPELRNKEIPGSLLAASAGNQMPRPSVDSEASSYPDMRPSSSRDGRPPLRTQQSSQSSLRNNDGLRPTTPGSVPSESRNILQSPGGSMGVKSPLNEGSDKASVDAPADLSGKQSFSDQPAPLKPTPLATTTSVPAAAETAALESANEPGPSGSAAEIASMSPVSSSEVPQSPVDEEDDGSHRPGLGPMIKKKQHMGMGVAGAFRKAATAYGAFKPRPGGAGERLLAAAKRQQDGTEPDGITGVVPAPSLRTSHEATRPGSPETPVNEAPSMPSPAAEVETPDIPSPAQEPPVVEVTKAAPDVSAIPTVEVHDEEPRETSRASMKAENDERMRSVSPSPNGRRRRRHADNTIRYCQAIGIEPGILEGRGIEFDDILTDLGWNGRLGDEKRIEDLEADIRREIGRVEASSWLGNLEQQEGKIDQLAKLIDKTVEECEELDNLLTLYSHELNTLNDDVAYIETQSQGLQVQTANQKLLQSELQNLLKTLSISSTDLRPLKEASLSNPDGLRDTEVALSTLYKAMLMIDSNIFQNKKRLVDTPGDHGGLGVYADTGIGQMRAIKEKKEEYRTESRLFLQRLRQFMSIAYKVAEQKRVDAAANRSRDQMKLDGEAREHAREELWRFNALMLFAREVSGSEWHSLMNLYEQQAKMPYQNEFRENGLAWKKAARKPTGEEQELLFTHQEKDKDGEGITMAARKLTVKRGKTIRAAAGLRHSFGEKQHGKLDSYEVFAGALQETLTMISVEQNFVVHFFHLDSLSTAEFPDLVSADIAGERRRPNFAANKSHDPDRAMAKRVEQLMDELYGFWPTDMQNMVDWAIKADPLQGIGILLSLEKALSDFDDTNQDFIIHSVQKLHTRLIGLFNRFVDEQIRGIEDTKVKVNKRKGVISFMRVFPHFSTAVESMFSQPEQEFFDIRISVNDAYDRINRAMWESLKFIAKEAPGHSAAVAAASGGDPEDKEVLNYHILLIENMNHYIEEVDVRGLPVLERWHDRARQDMAEHMGLYVDLVIRRPLGKLLEFVESLEGLLAGASHPPDIANRPGHSRSVAKKLLSAYDSKEIKRGIELLKKRVEKHFGDADDPGLSRSLVAKVQHECEGRYEATYDRTRQVLDAVYEGQLEPDWRKEEATAMFKK
ncbi:GTP-Rho binding exocyst subunit SEC3 [Aspergillus candidus]|uniref:Exocyst complex component Sec3-domain-containing protein n=1 Tax=Aspergillus candidus TaxID=41067 RepID=A0A2I2FMQ8_ASPCN|nr:exocyst complex component Sec3-domain-containing protein [Aspergillus candidus]PLB41899.1 exocyst complex component Sec3-domain-containing protein [Aspergillus candidus]